LKEAIGRCALNAFGRFPYNVKYETAKKQVNGLLSRVGFSPGVEEMELELKEEKELKKILQDWWQDLRHAPLWYSRERNPNPDPPPPQPVRNGIFEREAVEPSTPRDLVVGVEKFGLTAEEGVTLGALYDIVCGGASLADPKPKYKVPFLCLSFFFKMLRSSGILSNHVTFKIGCMLFEGAGREYDGPDTNTKEPQRAMSCDDFTLLLSQIGDLSYGDPKGAVYIVTSEERLSRLLKSHLFPSMLVSKSVIGDNRALQDIMENVEVLHLLDLSEDFFKLLFLTYTQSESLTGKTAINLEQLETMLTDIHVVPMIITLEELVGIFCCTGTKKKRKFPHFMEMLARIGIMAFSPTPERQHDPLRS